MGFTQTFFGSDRLVPQTKDRNWGPAVTGILKDAMTYLEDLGFLASSRAMVAFSGTDSSLAADATLSPATPVHLVQGSGGPITLSVTTAISAGAKDGQILALIGAHASNFVTVPDGAGTDLQGSITLELGHAILLRWNATRSLWEEITRNN